MLPTFKSAEAVARNRLAPIAGFERKVDSERAGIDAVLNMAPNNDQEIEVAPTAEQPVEIPLPSDPKVIFLGGLFVLALLTTAYVASECCPWSLPKKMPRPRPLEPGLILGRLQRGRLKKCPAFVTLSGRSRRVCIELLTV